MEAPLFDGKLVHSQRIIYTPSPFARSNLVHLQGVGRLQARSPHASTRKGLASYLFFMVESGSGTLEYDGTTRALRAGDCAFLDCRKPYRHYTGEDLWQLRWVHFYGPNMGAIYKKYEERGGQPSFRAENAAAYAALLETLYTLADSDNYVRDMQICEKLLALLTLLMQESWHPEAVRAGSAKRQNLQEIKDYLDAHYGEKITLDALAEQFYINKFYLTRVFKEQFGQTVTGYLMQLASTGGNGKQSAGAMLGRHGSCVVSLRYFFKVIHADPAVPPAVKSQHPATILAAAQLLQGSVFRHKADFFVACVRPYTQPQASGCGDPPKGVCCL